MQTMRNSFFSAKSASVETALFLSPSNTGGEKSGGTKRLSRDAPKALVWQEAFQSDNLGLAGGGVLDPQPFFGKSRGVEWGCLGWSRLLPTLKCRKTRCRLVLNHTKWGEWGMENGEWGEEGRRYGD